ncbi:UNVERIFIED_CONTAM: Retrovirus-related Pol polyprotein from transposon TNT 1-94 [Sesamum radiatum]|uniref:Retrovirus-related Pol polyprotein from transposon TNT 1-94 n=1 Tax=Sesamum radiatum TaxID=300843 RepID=A0AAW2S7I6_SESRA
MKNIPYSNAIGSIMFLMVCTRPDIAYSISCLSRYMSNAGLPHWEALKWLLRYLNGSANRGLIFSKCAKGVDLIGYVDSNYANDRDSRRNLLKNGDDDKTLTQSLDRFPETVPVQGGVCNKMWPMTFPLGRPNSRPNSQPSITDGRPTYQPMGPDPTDPNHSPDPVSLTYLF